MKTLIKMIMLGVVMTSGMVIAEGETAGGSTNYETGSFNFTENQNADINSVINGGTNYGDIQGANNTYNCDVAGACSGSSINGGGSNGGGGSYGGGSSTNLITAQDLAQGYATQDTFGYVNGDEITKFVYQDGTADYNGGIIYAPPD